MISVVVGIAALWGTLTAQIPIIPEIPETLAPEPAAELASPRATLETFEGAMRDREFSEARRTLDLSGFNQVVRSAEGDRVARRLAEIFERVGRVDPETVPEVPDEVPYTLLEFPQALGVEGEPIGAIRLAPDATGEWRFTAETVASIESILEFVREYRELDLESTELIAAPDPIDSLRDIFPASYRTGYFGIEWWSLIVLGGLIVVAYLIALVSSLVLRFLIGIYYRIGHEPEKKQIIGRARSRLGMLFGLLFLEAALPGLSLPIWLLSILLIVLHVLKAIVLLLLLFDVWDVASTAIAGRTKDASERTEKLVIPIIRNLGKGVIVVAVGLFLLNGLGFNVVGLVAGLGIGGLVVAFAAKDSVENFFGSITILFEAPFGIGDWIKVGDIEGTVEEISLRSSRIRTFQDSLIILPNSQLITASVENFGRRRYRRMRIFLGLTYDTPPEKITAFCEKLRKTIALHPKTRKDVYFVHFNGYADFSLDILVQCFFEVPDFAGELEAREELLLAFLQAAKEVGVEYAFPTRTLVFDGKNSAGKLGIQQVTKVIQNAEAETEPSASDRPNSLD